MYRWQHIWLPDALEGGRVTTPRNNRSSRLLLPLLAGHGAELSVAALVLEHLAATLTLPLDARARGPFNAIPLGLGSTERTNNASSPMPLEQDITAFDNLSCGQAQPSNGNVSFLSTSDFELFHGGQLHN
jgi:hypothetical protein